MSSQTGLLDFLLQAETGLSRNGVKSLLTRGAVSVNGRKVTKFDTPLKPGMAVFIRAPGEDRRAEVLGRLKILYEDDELIAADKPAGLLAIATDSEPLETAYRILTAYVRLDNPRSRIFVVHRLDRDTSGVMLAAKTERMKTALQENWNTLVRTRGYTAVAEGVFAEKSGVVRSWLKETTTHVVYESRREGDGQEAVMRYEVTRESASHSLLSVRLDTGRKNQIRVQLSGLGHPVAGDKKYGAAADPLGRLCLHAGLLEVEHPFSGGLMVFESAVPKAFLSLLRKEPGLNPG